MIRPEAALGNFVDAMNHELRDLPPGPERNARIREIAQKQLAAAKTPNARIFWEAMLKEFT